MTVHLRTAQSPQWGSALRLCRDAALLLLVTMTCACSSIPLSTLWKLHSFDANDILALDPQALRAAVSTDFGAVDPSDMTLTLSLKDGAGTVHRLKMAMTGAAGEAGPAAAGNWQVARLTEASAGKLQNLRDQLHGRQNIEEGSVNFGWYAKLPKIPDSASEVHLNVYLRLADHKDWMPLIEDKTLQINRS